LIGETSGLRHQQFLIRRSSMTKPTEESRYHRYELVHGDDADFIAYQRHRGDGVWQTFATWMIPRTA
jgi:hypothetical protein